MNQNIIDLGSTPPSNSHHQDCCTFCRESLQTIICHYYILLLGIGGRSNMDLLKLGEFSSTPENHSQTPLRATIVQLDRAISRNSTPAPQKDRDPENSTVGGSEIRPIKYTWTLWIVSHSISNCQGILSWISMIPVIQMNVLNDSTYGSG